MIGPTLHAVAAVLVVLTGDVQSTPPSTPPTGLEERLPNATPLPAVAMDPAKSIATGTQRYGMAMHARSTADNGTLTFDSTYTMTTRRDGGMIVLEDAFTVMGREFRTVFVCEPDPYLSMIRGELTMTRGETVSEATMQRDGAVLAVAAGEREQEIDFPEGTVLHAGVMRIVQMLPRTAGAAYTFPSFSEAVELQPRSAPPGRPYSIECTGESVERIGGNDMTCTGYRVRTNKDWACFVNQGGTLCLVVADQGDMRMELLGPESDAQTATAEE